MSQRIDVGALCHYGWWRLEQVREGSRWVYECRVKPGKGIEPVKSRRNNPGDAVRFALVAAAEARAAAVSVPPARTRSIYNTKKHDRGANTSQTGIPPEF